MSSSSQQQQQQQQQALFGGPSDSLILRELVALLMREEDPEILALQLEAEEAYRQAEQVLSANPQDDDVDEDDRQAAADFIENMKEQIAQAEREAMFYEEVDDFIENISPSSPKEKAMFDLIEEFEDLTDEEMIDALIARNADPCLIECMREESE